MNPPENPEPRSSWRTPEVRGDAVREQKSRLKQSVLDTVVEAHYPEVVKSAGTARSRAQVAQTITSLLAGSLLAAFTVSSLADHFWGTKIAAVLAVTFWCLAGVMYVRAVAVPVATLSADDVKTGDQLVRRVLDLAKEESRRVDQRQNQANCVAVTGMVMTLVTYALVLFMPAQPLSTQGNIVLAPEGRATLEQICPDAPDPLVGRVHQHTLTESFVSVTVTAERCDGLLERTVHVPVGSVETVVLER